MTEEEKKKHFADLGKQYLNDKNEPLRKKMLHNRLTFIENQIEKLELQIFKLRKEQTEIYNSL